MDNVWLSVQTALVKDGEVEVVTEKANHAIRMDQEQMFRKVERLNPF